MRILFASSMTNGGFCWLSFQSTANANFKRVFHNRGELHLGLAGGTLAALQRLLVINDQQVVALGEDETRSGLTKCLLAFY